MLLKGFYTTAEDRLPIDTYKGYMFERFSIIIEEPAGYGRYTGFIKRNPCYDIYVPFVNDGHIGSMLHHDMRRYSVSGVVELKKKIRQMIKEHPERFVLLAQATKCDRDAWKKGR